MRPIKMGMMLLLVWPTSAFADGTAADEATRVAARQIAGEGMMAFDVGDCATATEKLARAHEILHAPTVAYYAGTCFEKLGRLAEALRMYEAAVLDPIAGAADVQRKAQEDAAAAKARLLPVLFPAKAPGPRLPETAPHPVVAKPEVPARVSPGPWIVGSVGVVGLVVGAVVGGVVVAKHAVVGAHCTSGPPAVCQDQTGVDAANAVRTLGPIVTTGFVVGGVGLVAAGVWLGVQRRGQAVKVGIAGTSLRLEGSW